MLLDKSSKSISVIQWQQNDRGESRFKKVEQLRKNLKVIFRGGRELMITKLLNDSKVLDIFFNIIDQCIQLQPCRLTIILGQCQSFNGSKLVDISPLNQLRFLTNLNVLSIDLSSNHIIDITPFNQLKSLTNLFNLTIILSCNKIQDITPLSEIRYLINLQSLEINLKQNKIYDISPIGDFKTLVRLTNLSIDFWRNQIEDITPVSELRYLTNLTNLQINLKSNCIKDISPLSKLRSFKSLFKLKETFIDLRYNRIKPYINGFSDLKFLQKYFE